MARSAASYGEAVLHKSLTMKHCFAKAPQYEASPFHSDMKHFAYAPYDVRKWKMRVYPFAIQRYPHYIMTCNPVLYGWIFFTPRFYPQNLKYLQQYHRPDREQTEQESERTGKIRLAKSKNGNYITGKLPSKEH